MPLLSEEDLVEIECEIIDNLFDDLHVLNEQDALKDLFSVLNRNDLANKYGLNANNDYWKRGKILVVGHLLCSSDKLLSVARAKGFSKDRFDFVGYKEATNYDFGKLCNSMEYSAVLFGGVPHSCAGGGDGESIISHMEKHQYEYPAVVRLYASDSNKTLKITKTSFAKGLVCIVLNDLVECW